MEGRIVVFDTCALLWATLSPDSLSPSEKEIAFACFENQEAVVSSISFWEVGIKMKKKKLNIGMSLKEYIDKIHLFNGFEIVPVDETIWMENINLDWDHRDPADRTIVATAKLKDLPILTKDDIIRKYYKKQGWA